MFFYLDSCIADLNSDKVKDRYNCLMEQLKSHINPALMMERLSEDTLENLSLIPSKHQFQTRYVRTKTRLFFKQQKFNLLREETEGYAKLLTELSQPTNQTSSKIHMVWMNQIQSLIGYFDLDPNRVLDLILDIAEFRLSLNDHRLTLEFVQLIKLYNPDRMDLTHILGHKFKFFQVRMIGRTIWSSVFVEPVPTIFI